MENMERWRTISGMIIFYNIYSRTEYLRLFSVHWRQKPVTKLGHAFKSALCWYEQLVSVLLLRYLWVQNRMQLTVGKARTMRPSWTVSRSLSLLILFCFSYSDCLFSCISTCHILQFLQNLLQTLPYDLLWYILSFSYILQGLINLIFFKFFYSFYSIYWGDNG